MAVGGIGGLFGQLINPNLDMDVARQMTPNPNPLAQQGPGGVGPKSVDSLGNAVPNPSQQPPLAPGAYTQPDPVNASYNANLIKMAQRDAYGADLNRNIEGIAAGFGTAQQQASKQAALRGGGVGSSLIDLATIQKMQGQTIEDNEHARYMGNITILAQRMGVTPAEIVEMSNTKEGRDQISNVIGGNLTATGTMKDAEAATRAWAAANPKATPEMIAAHKANLIAGGMGGGDLDQREYLAAVDAGTFKGNYSDWKSQKALEASTKANEAKDATDHKDTAIEGYTAANEKLTKTKGTVDRLLNNIDDTMTALATPDMLSSGKGPAWLKKIPIIGGQLVPSKTTLGLAADIRTLKAELSSSALTDVKNVRNRMEFETIGNSLTAALDAANTPEDVQRALVEVRHKVASLNADIKASAGKPLTREEAALANSQYITKVKKDGSPNPYYGGSTIMEEDESNSSDSAPAPKRRRYNEKGELVD